MSSYKEVLAWQKAMDLIDAVYIAVRQFPKSETFVLSQQMRAAAISIACNIAEGRGRWTTREYRQFLIQARGSTLEVQTQILIAQRQRFISTEEGERLEQLANQVGRLINGLIRALPRPKT